MAEQSKKLPDINDERSVRLGRLDLLNQKNISAYPANVKKHISTNLAISKPAGAKVAVVGRIMMMREFGKLTFCKIQDESGSLQVVFKQQDIGEEKYKVFLKLIDLADIVYILGERFVTQKGEQSVLVADWELLAKALRPLPDKFHGLQDEELRLRKRYLDLLLDFELKELFYRKAKFWQSMRSFLVDKGFLEVETPVLEVTTGGADAEPFTSHHNALDLDVHLRISMGELWQKRLMVAGFEKTFEIGRQFRNEGMSCEHLQDYSQMEFYLAYADYKAGMQLVQKMYQHVAKETWGTLNFDIGQFVNIDLSGNWGEIDYVETIKEKTGINVLEAGDEDMKKKLKELNVDYEKGATAGRLIDSLWKYCRREIKGPVFLVNLPVEVSPLAKRMKDNPRLTERYQVLIAGSELGNGYSELNDPVDQADRFAGQERMREAGDAEAQMFDHEFVEALEHGMPPTTGFGVSERLFSFLENKPIRDCVLFPLVKPAGVKPNFQSTAKENNISYEPLPMDRDKSLKLVKKYNHDKALINHYLESEAVMRAVARELGENEDYWGILGLLHDLDWEETREDSLLHGTKSPDMLRKAGFPEDFIAVIISHIYGFGSMQNKKRTEKIQHALASSETVTGLIHAASIMRPTKIVGLELSSVKKKFKDKKFAAGVNREVVLECEKAGVPLDKFLELAIEAIKGIASEVGLK